MTKAFGLFAAEWISSPLGVGAIAPSGRALADLITQGLGPDDGPIIELGPGTGVFTRALLARGIPENRIAVVERGTRFVTALSTAHQGLAVHHGDAAGLARMQLFGKGRAAMIICGLPLLSMPRRVVHRILTGAVAHLAPGAAFRTFTYQPSCPVPSDSLNRLRLSAWKIGHVSMNMPPACVYELRIRPDGDELGTRPLHKPRN